MKRLLGLKEPIIKKNKILLGFIIFFLLIMIMLSIFYIRVTHVEAQARKEATILAKEYAQIENVDSFYWFNRKETYFTIVGENNEGEKKVVIIPQKSEEIIVLNQKDGLNEQEIREKIGTNYAGNTIQKITLGIYEKKPSWEVVTQNDEGLLNYYLFSFKDGEEIKAIKNI